MTSTVVPAAVTGGQPEKRKGVFVRCCGDLGWNCLKCPKGLQNNARNSKNIYSCENPNGPEAYDSLGNILDGSGGVEVDFSFWEGNTF